MKITKFKLLREGREGIEIEAKEYLGQGKWKVVDEVKRKRTLPLSDDLLDDIRKLKYFFLNLTGHWIPVYNQFYDPEARTLLPVENEPKKIQLHLKDLWNNTTITGAKAGADGFLLTGKIETVEDKVMGLSTPFITADDDIGFFTECSKILDKIAHSISDYVTSVNIPIKQGVEKLDPEAITDKTKEEIAEMVTELFHEKGAIIMMNDNGQDKLENSTTVHESKKSIDSQNMPEAKESEEPTKSNKQSATDNSGGGRSEDVGENGAGTVGSDSSGEGEVNTSKADEAITQQSKKKEPYGKPAAEIPADVSGDIPVDKKGKSDDVPASDLEAMEHSENMGGTVDPDGEQEEESEDEW